MLTESEKVSSSDGLDCVVKIRDVKMRSRFYTNNYEHQVSNPGRRSLIGMLNHCAISDPVILGVISVHIL